MKVVRYGSYGQHVKFCQATLDFLGYELSVDGHCGKKTRAAIKAFQNDHGLKDDGVCGPLTWAALGFRATKNKNIACIELPFERILSAGVLLEDGRKMSCMKFAQYGFDIVLNGGFFELATLKSCTCIYEYGKLQCYGNANSGIAYLQTDGSQFVSAYPLTRAEAAGKPVDMLCGAPVLIQNGVKCLDMEGISQATYTKKTRRTCAAVTDKAVLLFFSMANMSLEDMLEEGLNQKVTYMQGHDGGGSQSLVIGGNWVLTTDGRSIPSAVGFVVRKW